VEQFVGGFAIQVTRQDDHIFFVRFHDGTVDTGYVIKSLGIGNGGHLRQVVVACLVFGKENHLVTVVFSRFVGVVLADKKLTPHNRLDDGFGRRATCFFCFFIFSLSSLVMVENGTDKLERTHHVPVVGNCHG